MKAPTFTPAYVALFPVLCEIAREHGYALAVHGSVARDYDLLAVPWTDEATNAETLMLALAKRCHLIYGEFGTGIAGPENKPHGRIAWSLLIGAGAYIDLSVMPRTNHTVKMPVIPQPNPERRDRPAAAPHGER